MSTTSIGRWYAPQSDDSVLLRQEGEQGTARKVRGFIPPVNLPSFLLFTGTQNIRPVTSKTRLERAIGVIYLPDSELQSHYFSANLAQQFDAVIYFEESSAVEPLEKTAEWPAGEVPETYPTGL